MNTAAINMGQQWIDKRWCCFSVHSCLEIHFWTDPQLGQNFVFKYQISIEVQSLKEGATAHVSRCLCRVGLCQGLTRAHHSAFLGQPHLARDAILSPGTTARLAARKVEHSTYPGMAALTSTLKLTTPMSAFCDGIGKPQKTRLNELRIFPNYSARSLPVTFGALDCVWRKGSF